MVNNSNWWVNTPDNPGILPGSNYGNGGTTGAVQYRGPLDAARAAKGQLSQAEFPDGYLGNIIDRRQGKLEDLQTRLTDRSYQRGVHKGSKIDPDEYYWPTEVGLMSGVQRQARYQDVPYFDENGVTFTQNTARFTPHGDPVEVLAHLGKTSGLATPGQVAEKMEESRQAGVNPAMNPIVVQDPVRIQAMQSMLPKYRSGR